MRWIVSILVVGAVVAAVLYATREDDVPPGTGPKAAPLPAALTEHEVQSYLAVWPEVNAQGQANANEFVKIWEATGKYPDDPAMGLRHRAAVEAILQKHGYTTGTFEVMRKRVERVVDVLRWEQDAPARQAEIDRRIREKEALRESLSGETRAQVEREIEQLKAQRDAGAPGLREKDRELATKYWERLDRIVPRLGPAPADASR